MRKIIIEGGHPLSGEVEISTAKNSVLPILAASILADSPVILKKLPQIRDVKTMLELLKRFGVEIDDKDYNEVKIDASHVLFTVAPYEIIKTMRASFIVLGPLTAKMGRCRVSMPGGCAIGTRPVDLHLKGLKKLGATIEIEEGYILAKAPKLKGNRIVLDFPSVGATENLMMAATLAEGETIIENAAREPEIVDLANFLQKMGADIEGAGTHTIHIYGLESLKGTEYQPIPDRIEAGTFIIAGSMMAGPQGITVKNVEINHLDVLFEKLAMSGAQFEIDEKEKKCHIFRNKHVQPLDITSAPYPGFPTDLQAQIMAMLIFAEGTSLIKEEIFENRFMHVAELKRMGANIEIKNSTAIIKGIKTLTGAPVMVSDLRAGAAMILAALKAEGKTIISRIYHIERGYENLVKKLQNLGAKIMYNTKV
jgi:UDP-N-acetylglucosamine 1-carboxyvinyltransferase